MKYHTYLLIINWLISFNTIGSILPTQTVLPRYVRLGQYLLWEFPNSLHPPGEKKEKILTSPSVSFAGLSRSYWFLCPTLLYIKWFFFFWHTRSPHLPTYLFPPFVVVSDQAYTDVIFITGSVGFSAHRFYIAAAAPSLARLITTATANSDINCSDIGTRSSSDCSMVRCIDSYWLNGPVILFISYVCDMCDGNQVSSVGDTSASGGSSYHSEETDTTCLLDVDRTHYLRLSNRIKEKLKRRCSFQVRSNSAANELN